MAALGGAPTARLRSAGVRRVAGRGAPVSHSDRPGTGHHPVGGPPAQGVEGTQELWNPKGTRAGRCTVATGGPEKEVASRTTRSLASRVAS